VDKIKNFPAVSFEDFSKSQIIKILNDKAWDFCNQLTITKTILAMLIK
jgi:hypothetical protein